MTCGRHIVDVLFALQRVSQACPQPVADYRSERSDPKDAGRHEGGFGPVRCGRIDFGRPSDRYTEKKKGHTGLQHFDENV